MHNLLNHTIHITYSIDYLSIFTIPSLYEVNDIYMKSQYRGRLLPTPPLNPTYLINNESLYHKLSPLLFPICVWILLQTH